MKILHILPTHNASAALFENGKCLAYLQEEMFNNIKNYWGFPAKAIDYLDTKYSLKNLDYIVIPTQQLMASSLPLSKTSGLAYQTEAWGTSSIRKLTDYLEYKLRFKTLFFMVRSVLLDKIISTSNQKSMQNYLTEKYGVTSKNILFLDHHTCHAFSPIHFYNLHTKKNKYLIFTLDGSGDNYCSKTFIYNPKDNQMKLVSSTRFDSSVGLLYSGLTKFLGMKPVEHEYKVMGLASYVTEKKYYQHILDRLKKDISFDTDNLKFNTTFNTNYSYYYFKEYFTGERFDNLSAAVQNLTEELVISWISSTIKKYKIKNIACVGGVFMNVKMNKKIQEIGKVNKVYFMPSSSDESTGYGDVFDLFMKNNIKPASSSTMFSGLEYSNNQVEEYIKKNKLHKVYKIKKIRNVEEKIANLLSKHKIVAWFNGAGEWGARSLCHRTILANASRYTSYQNLNDTIKMRDFWMPFAPTILDRWAKKYLKDWDKTSRKVGHSAKYMITAFDTTIQGQADLIAAVHQKDKTIRPQIVSEGDHPKLYKMLNIFEKLTGYGGLLNTSLNIHGYPIAGSLDQAIFTFKYSQLEYLVINDYLFTK